MKLRSLSLAVLVSAAAICLHASDYSPANPRLMTTWGEQLTPENVWQEYPRPIMERESWENLNGLWKYAITPATAPMPKSFEGDILVPFCVESALSGVGRTVGADSVLWYQTQFAVPQAWKGDQVKLNFDAVDWKADVWVNGVYVGGHTGGYAPFSFNITPALVQKGKNTLTVRVFDPTDKGYQPHGKQVAKPHGIWYTPVTGIWQTVWLEPVGKTHIESLRTLPDIDSKTLTVTPEIANAGDGVITEIKVYDPQGQVVATGKGISGVPVEIAMPADMKLWSPDAPNLYDLQITVTDPAGRVLDKVKSYAAMRKISKARDKNGHLRMQLNNKDLFQYGPLDQGWWPDGLYTPPSHEAMVYDIQKTKDLGFNMIRKHIKVEPPTWYTACDKMGILVWQDMPSGDMSKGRWEPHNYLEQPEKVRSAKSEANYRKEWNEIINHLYSYPCIVVWVPFNEGWGQFKTVDITEWTQSLDPSRLVNSASGGNFFHTGDILDLHNYPAPAMYLQDAERVNALGEFGGIGMVVDGHIWAPDRNWGYISFKSPKEVTDEYVKYARQLKDLVDRGFSAGVYTQTTDVEIEVNGLMTYDRKIMKVDQERVAQINRELTGSLPVK
ncbi:MAG: beta galactosidase jelly roll domain-containing protein [Muribaculaceae bacterium]|nr:beta galactosidase jelly roll domain-containing protein [Muribaculaceae bacterium]